MTSIPLQRGFFQIKYNPTIFAILQEMIIVETILRIPSENTIFLLNYSPINVTLLSAQLSSLFCITTLLKKQLISPILFGLAKSSKKSVILQSLGNQKICKSQCIR